MTLVLISAASIVVGQSAATGLTLNLPVLSRQPCILVLAALPLVLAGTAAARYYAERHRVLSHA